MSTQEDIRVTVRVDRNLKESADNLFKQLGMNMTTAFNIFLRKAVDENAIPFPVSVKPTGFGAGLTADYIGNAFTEIVADEKMYNRRQGFPIAGYDAEHGQAYLEYSDGLKEYIGIED